MKKVITDAYNGWTIRVNSEHNMCSNFSFDIVDPSGREKHVSMGGDNENRALARAKEMVDMEIAMTREDY
jgi:hypothetical protein